MRKSLDIRSSFYINKSMSLQQGLARTRYSEGENMQAKTRTVTFALKRQLKITFMSIFLPSSAECVTYSTDYYKRLTLESWFTNLEQTPLNRCQQLPAAYTNDLLTKQTNIRLYPPTNLTNNTTTEITLTIHRSKRTNHGLES